jgi:hypothetical protein
MNLERKPASVGFRFLLKQTPVMKKTFTLFSLLLTFGLAAQNYSVFLTDPSQTIYTQTLVNGSVVSMGTSATTNTSSPSVRQFKVLLQNKSSSTITLNVTRRIVYNSPALKLDGAGNIPDTYFCFGYNCFPSTVSQPNSSDYCILGAMGSTVTPDNSRDNATPFVIDLAENTTIGKYYVNYKVYDVNNISDSVSFVVRYNEFLSVQENKEVISSVGNVYPNPSTGLANFDVVLNQDSPVKIEVYNSIGSLVYKNSEQRLIGKNKLSVDCSNFNCGLYFVTLTSGDSKVTKRLTVTK